MNKRGITIALFVGTFVFFAFSASAATGLLPECANTPGDWGGCTLCDIWPLANNIINFLLFAIAIPLLTVVLIWGGVMWTTAGASPKNIEQGKKIMTSGIIGILIAFAGWLIVDTIIKSLASGGSIVGAWQTFPDQNACKNPKLAEETFTFQDIVPGGGGGKNWIAYKCINKTDCDIADPDKATRLGSFSTAGECRMSAEKEGPETNGAETNWKCVEKTGGGGGGQCNTATNVCDPKPRQCSGSACAQYAGYTSQYANSIATASLLKSIIINESSCNAGAESGVGACGLTQLLPSTANMFKSQCGITSSVDIDCTWLKTHPEKAICIAAAYIEGIGNGRCGNDVRNIAAGYNGGEGACQASNSCADETSCGGSTVRKWECLYDDSAHTQCNEGYVETRNYAPKVLYCASNPGF